MSTEPTAAVTTCYRHPDRRAGVTCQRCDRPICPDCMNTASVGFHCPDCARAGGQKVYTKSAIARLNRPVVTTGLVVANVGVYVAGLVESSSGAFAGRGGFIVDGGLYGPAVAAGEWWRIFTSGFLHAGVLHLGLNMWLLYLLGSALEPALGRAAFSATYTTSLVCGSLGVLLLDPNNLTVGASGAVFGLMGALYVLFRARGINPWSTGIGPTIAINLVFTFAVPGISIGGHVGGLIGGALAGVILTDGARSIGAKAAAGAVAALGAAAFVACLLVA